MIFDGTDSSNWQQQITVEPVTNVNEPVPIGNDDSYQLIVDRLLVLNPTANDEDPEGNPLTVLLVSEPQHGLALVNGSTVIYVPSLGYVGNDSFTYRPSNGLPEGDGNVATVTLTILDPVTFMDGDTRTVKVIEIDGITATTYFDSALFQAEVIGSPGVLNAKQAQTNAVQDADTAWESGEQAAYEGLESDIADNVESLTQVLAGATAAYEGALADNEAPFLAALDGFASAKEQSYTANKQQFDASVAGIGSGAVEDITADPAVLTALGDSLRTPAVSFSNSLAVADSHFNGAIPNARSTWEVTILEAQKDAIQHTWDEEETLLLSIETAATAFADNLIGLIQAFAGQINGVIVGAGSGGGLSANIASRHATYLEAVRDAKADAEEAIENVLEGKREDILDAYAVFYQALAEYLEQSMSELERKEVVKQT